MLQRQDKAEARVMVVDDDPQILASLQTLLEPWGLAVLTLEDPRVSGKRHLRQNC